MIAIAVTDETKINQRWVQVKKHAYQQGFGHLAGRMLYNTVGGGGMPEGSTVTIESLLKQGYRVEVVE